MQHIRSIISEVVVKRPVKSIYKSWYALSASASHLTVAKGYLPSPFLPTFFCPEIPPAALTPVPHALGGCRPDAPLLYPRRCRRSQPSGACVLPLSPGTVRGENNKRGRHRPEPSGAAGAPSSSQLRGGLENVPAAPALPGGLRLYVCDKKG